MSKQAEPISFWLLSVNKNIVSRSLLRHFPTRCDERIFCKCGEWCVLLSMWTCHCGFSYRFSIYLFFFFLSNDCCWYCNCSLFCACALFVHEFLIVLWTILYLFPCAGTVEWLSMFWTFENQMKNWFLIFFDLSS